MKTFAIIRIPNNFILRRPTLISHILSGSSSSSAGRGQGREIAATSTSRPLRAAQPGDRRSSRSMRGAPDGRPGSVGGWDGSGSALLASGTCCRRRRCASLPAPVPGAAASRSPPRPCPPANGARPRPSRHRLTAPPRTPSFGRASLSHPAPGPNGHALSAAFSDPAAPTHPPAKPRVKLGKGGL